MPVPGGVGALEAAVQESYKLAGAIPGIGLLAVGAYRVTTILVAAIGSVYYLASRRQIQEMLAAEQAEADNASDDATHSPSTAELPPAQLSPSTEPNT